MNRFTAIIPIILIVTLSACGNDEEVAYEDDETKVTINKESGVSTFEAADGDSKVEAKFQQDGNLPLPSDFPKDVPIVPGATLQANIRTDELYNLSFRTSKSPEELSAYYDERLKANGWKITAVTNMMGFTMIVGEKGDRNCQIHIAKEGDDTVLMINVIQEDDD